MLTVDHATTQPPVPNVRPNRLRMILLPLVIALVVSGASCMHIKRDNRAYPATNVEVRAALAEMKDAPVALERPVLVLSGYRSPPSAGRRLAAEIRALTGTGQDDLAALGYMWADDIEPLGDRVVAFVDEHWPTDDPERTTEIDVVAISMGGIVARWAAAEREPGARRLNIGTLYTLGTPHRGAVIADRIRPDSAAAQLRAGSGMLDFLDSQLESADYEIVPYAVLNDWMVGATRTAPPGADPIWVPGRAGVSHFLISREDRIIADIARRLRGEDPLGMPSAPPRD